MISVLVHELEEVATDPNTNAWYDAHKKENADKCAWTFGHNIYKVGNGSSANVRIGARDYLIQRNLYHGLDGPAGNGDYCMMDQSHNNWIS